MPRGSVVVSAFLACAGCEQILGIEDPSAGGSGSGSGSGGMDAGSGSGSDGSACEPVPAFPPTPSKYSVGGGLDLAVGDLDGNGIVDVVVAVGAQGVLVFSGTASGLSSSATFPSVAPANGVLLVDIDHDAKLDVVTWTSTAQVTVYHQEANFKFTPTSFMADDVVVAIIAGDVNGDQRDDLVVGTRTSISTWVASATPGTFTAGQTVVALTNPVGVVDIDGDGLVDIAVSDSSGVHVFFNTPGSAGVFPAAPLTIGGANTGGVFGHFGGATAGLDLVEFDTAMKTGALYRQSAPHQFTEAIQSAVRIDAAASSGKPGIQALDLDGDHRDDLATVGYLAVQCESDGFYPRGDAAVAPLPIGATTDPTSVQLFVDLDANGKPDLLQLDENSGSGAQFLQVWMQ